MEARFEGPQTPPVLQASPIKLVAGLFFAVLGVVLTLANFGLIDGDRLLRFWPVVLVAVGLIEISRAGDRTAGAVLAALGTLLLAWTNRWIRVSLFDLWPLLLIAAGVAVVVQALGVRASTTRSEGSHTIWAVLSQRKIIEESKDYTGGRILAFMGGCDLDLTRADIQRSPAIINVAAVWGGIVIRIPAGWEVVGEAMPVMGGIEIRTRGASGGRRLVVRGLTLMGGMEIKTEAARTE